MPLFFLLGVLLIASPARSESSASILGIATIEVLPAARALILKPMYFEGDSDTGTPIVIAPNEAGAAALEIHGVASERFDVQLPEKANVYPSAMSGGAPIVVHDFRLRRVPSDTEGTVQVLQVGATRPPHNGAYYQGSYAGSFTVTLIY